MRASPHLLLALAIAGTSCGESSPPHEPPNDLPEAFLAAPEAFLVGTAPVDGTLPAAELVIDVLADVEALSVQVDGDFTVAPPPEGPFAADSQVVLSLGWEGATDVPRLDHGRLTVDHGSGAVAIRLGAAVLSPGLPEAVAWTETSWGSWTTVVLPSAPFPYDGSAWEDASVRIAVPHGLASTQPIGTVTHLHGHYATLAETLASQGLMEQFGHAGRNAVFIAPQGPVEAASGDFGRLAEPDGHAALAIDVLGLLAREGRLQVPELGPHVVSAHSGGYRAAARLVEHGGLDVAAVHLFDALYAEQAAFRDYAARGRLLSSYTTSGGTVAQNESLWDQLTDDGLSPGSALHEASLLAHDDVIAWVPASHARCMRDGQHAARWLRTGPQAPTPTTPPVLSSVSSDGDRTHVRWVVEPGQPHRTVVVEGSTTGSDWSILAQGDTPPLEVPPTAWVRLRGDHPDALPSDAYPGDSDRWLVVDGFTRVFDGSYSEPTHDFAAWVASGLQDGASGARSEAVATGEVELSDYDRVIWLLGDESVADQTFDEREETALLDYIDGGGQLVVSGSELAYASSDAVLAGLHIELVADDAGTNQAGGYTFGAAYPEDYPDVLGGPSVVWSYSTGGAAAVSWSDQVIAVGFPLETLAPADRDPALAELKAVLDGSSGR